MSMLKHRGRQIYREFPDFKSPELRRWVSVYSSFEASGSRHWLELLGLNPASTLATKLTKQINSLYNKGRFDAMKSAVYIQADALLDPTEAIMHKLDMPRDQLYEGYGDPTRKFQKGDQVLVAINRHVLCGYAGVVTGTRPDGKLIVRVPNRENVVLLHAAPHELQGVKRERVSPRKVLQPVSAKRADVDFNDARR